MWTAQVVLLTLLPGALQQSLNDPRRDRDPGLRRCRLDLLLLRLSHPRPQVERPLLCLRLGGSPRSPSLARHGYQRTPKIPIVKIGFSLDLWALTGYINAHGRKRAAGSRAGAAREDQAPRTEVVSAVAA